MYSPKIREDLIPQLYFLAKKAKKPMTKVVDGILRPALTDIRASEITQDLLKGGEVK